MPKSNSYNNNTYNTNSSKNTTTDVVVNVKDSYNKPILGCVISVKGEKREIHTDANGNATLTKVKSGSTIITRHVGYQSREIKINGNVPKFLNVTMNIGSGTYTSYYYK